MIINLIVTGICYEYKKVKMLTYRKPIGKEVL